VSVLIQASVERGMATLRFPYSPEVIAIVKSVPGFSWSKGPKVWIGPEAALPNLANAVQGLGHRISVQQKLTVVPSIPPALLTGFRPYQVGATSRLLANPGGYLLTFEMRVGKTKPTAAALATMLASGLAQRAFIFYPGGVRHIWAEQLHAQTGLALRQFAGRTPFDAPVLAAEKAVPFAVFGCHYEIAHERREDLFALADAGPFVIVGDEIQMIKNRKAPRTKALHELARHKNAVARWGLTGTPMRNRNRDMWAMFEFVQPGSMGGYWSYAKRFCGAHQGEFGWEDHENTNTDELAARLSAISYRLLRRDVAQWLPKSDRAVFLCEMASVDAKRYYALEAQLAGRAGAALKDAETPGALDAMKVLAKATVGTKLGLAMERIKHHTEDRQAKVLVFANFHESLRDLWERCEPTDPADKPPLEVPVFCAGGWMLPDKRKKVIEQWKQTPGPAVLLANVLSSGVGIDLADAEVAIFIELAWVPADFMQAESRIQDVHLGKRTTPPVFEYLVVKRTIDEDMATKLLEKVKNIEAVVGADAETKGMADTLHSSGLVGSDRLGLRDTSDDTVNAAIAGLRARLLGLTGPVSDPGDTSESLAADVNEAFDDDEGADDE